MTKPYTLEQAKQIFHNGGCVLVVSNYKDNKTKMPYICVCGINSEINLHQFIQGNRCKKCGINKIADKFRKYNNVEQVKAIFKEDNCILLATEYKNTRTKMPYVCSCGNRSEITLSDFISGHRCRKRGNKKISKKLSFDIDYIKEIFQECGCILLATEYTNANAKVSYICKCGNHDEKSLAKFKTGQRCNECAAEKLRIAFAYTLEEVRDIFAKEGCVLNSEKYVNARQKLRYTCLCGRDSEISLGSFLSGNRCQKCRNDGNRKRFQAKYEDVKQIFIDGGCQLLEDDYTNSSTLMKYICSCGRQSVITLTAFKTGSRCRECGNEKNRGENSYMWNPDRDYIKLRKVIGHRCNGMIRSCLESLGKRKDTRGCHLLGYNREQLYEHIVNHSNWNNVKNGKWHIDHIFPVSAFIKFGITKRLYGRSWRRMAI